MAWIAPEIARVDEPQIGDDWSLLSGRLERNRSCLLYKCGGLTGKQLAERSVPPSTMSLLGLVRQGAMEPSRGHRGQELAETCLRTADR